MLVVEGKVVMISGGSRGLGAALARRFVGDGAAVSICARGSDELIEIRSGRSERAALTAMGITLNRLRDRLIGQYRIQRRGLSDNRKGAAYRLELEQAHVQAGEA